MATQLSLTADNTTMNDLSHFGYAMRAVNESPLDGTNKAIYLKQLRELQNTLAACDEHSVEHFVATQEMAVLESDFWAAVDHAKREQQLAYQQSQSAELSQRLRSIDLN